MAGASATRTTPACEDQHVSAQLRDVESRLVRTHSDGTPPSEDRVRRTVAAVEARFADAHVRTFLPILVERAARVELERPAEPFAGRRPAAGAATDIPTQAARGDSVPRGVPLRVP